VSNSAWYEEIGVALALVDVAEVAGVVDVDDDETGAVSADGKLEGYE